VNRDRTLAAIAVALLVGAALLAVLAPGALADRSDTSVRPSYLDLREPRVAAGTVGGETAELSLDLRVEHRGGPAENVTVEVQAVSTDTGLVGTTVRKRLGRLPARTRTHEVRTRVNVSVPRENGYRLFIRVYENGSRAASGATEVSGVDSLTPDYADTPIEFHRFGPEEASPPVIRYSIEGSENNRTTLETQTYLTNRGDGAAGGLELVVTARQVESNVVAARERVTIDDIGPGRTATPTVTLDVPSEYNYYLDGLLLRDGVIVGTATSAATLDPTRPVPENETTEDVEFDTGEFADTPEREEEREAGRPEPTNIATGPGFGVAVAVLALLTIAIAALRRNP